VLERQIEATDWQIDALVYELYALTEEEIAIVEGLRTGAPTAEKCKLQKGEIFRNLVFLFLKDGIISKRKLIIRTSWLTFLFKSKGGNQMKKIIGRLLAIFLVLSACTFAASAVKPDDPGKPDGAGKPENLPPVSTDGDPAPEIIILPTGQTDNTPAADNAPGSITEDGPQDGVDWIPCV